MHFNLNKTSLFILGITSLVCSRALFFFFDDPEGPNLLIVTGMAMVLYLTSLIPYIFMSQKYRRGQTPTMCKGLLVAICIQVGIVIGLTVLLK